MGAASKGAGGDFILCAMRPTTINSAPHGWIDIARLIRPRSIAIVGISPEAGSPGRRLLDNLERYGYRANLLVSRNRCEVAGRACVPTIDDLPAGVDPVLFCCRAAIEDSVAASARHRAGAVIVFAAGFGEAGGAWGRPGSDLGNGARRRDRALRTELSRPHELCRRIPLTFSHSRHRSASGRAGIAVIAQSGGLATILRTALRERPSESPIPSRPGTRPCWGSRTISRYLSMTIPRALSSRSPSKSAGRSVPRHRRARPRLSASRSCCLHPGRSASARRRRIAHRRARGRLCVMMTLAAHHGVAMVESMDELIDVSRADGALPSMPPTAGPPLSPILAPFKGHDPRPLRRRRIDLPPLPAATRRQAARALPEFIEPSNPLDFDRARIMDLDLYERTIQPLLEDPILRQPAAGRIIWQRFDYAR